jgi:hypothetical protein
VNTVQCGIAAKSIGEMPSFAPKSDFWRDLTTSASEYLAAETVRGHSLLRPPRSASVCFTTPIIALSSDCPRQTFGQHVSARCCLAHSDTSGCTSIKDCTTANLMSSGGTMILRHAGYYGSRPHNLGNLASGGRR